MNIQYSSEFKKRYKKADYKIRSAFDRRIVLFVKDPYSLLLNNHALTGNYAGCRSINVTGDWRAIYREYQENDTSVMLFLLLGTHSELYK